MSTYEREMHRVSAGAGWWRAWRARFGWAEIGGTAGAVAGFAAGYQASGSLLAAAGLATMCEAAMFYGWVGAATIAAAGRATAHLAGWRRLAADVAWYGLEAATRCGLTRTLAFPAAMIMGNRGRPEGAPRPGLQVGGELGHDVRR